MREDLSDRDIISLVIGIVSLGLTIYFIEDKAIKISMAIAIVFVIVVTYLAMMFKEIKINSSEIKKINEKMDIHNRLSKIEIYLKNRGDKK